MSTVDGWPTSFAFYVSYVTSSAGYNANLPPDWNGKVLVHKYNGEPATSESCGWWVVWRSQRRCVGLSSASARLNREYAHSHSALTALLAPRRPPAQSPTLCTGCSQGSLAQWLASSQ